MTADWSNKPQLDEWDHWDDWDTPFPPAIYDQTTPDDLDQTLRDLDRIQADLSYQNAQTALKALVQDLDLTDPEQQGLETELQQLQVMIEKVEQQVVHIAVFGMVSRGKSSLLNALLGQPIFATGPLHGVTRNRQQVSWSIAPTVPGTDTMCVSLTGSGQSRIELIDTPGLDEIDGQTRAILARDIAQQADLILFVTAGDITRVEYDALADLREASKPMLLIFNKIDQYPDADRQAIYAKIRDERVRNLLSPDEIVMAAAAPLVPQPIRHADGSWSAELVAGPPQIDDLRLKILDILDREGKALVALNTLLYAGDVNEQILQRKLAIREQQAQKVIWQSVGTKALAIALNPITLVDMVSSTAIDVAMILTLSHLYGIPMTQKDAVGLLRNMAIATGGIGITERLATVGLSSLKGVFGVAAPLTAGASLVPYLSVAITQAAVAGLSAYSLGQVAQQYLANGASWGPNSPKTVVREILASIDSSYILHRIKTELSAKLYPAPFRFPTTS